MRRTLRCWNWKRPSIFPDPLAVVEVVFSKANVLFPAPGEYRVQLFAAGEPLRERRLHVLQSESDNPV